MENNNNNKNIKIKKPKLSIFSIILIVIISSIGFYYLINFLQPKPIDLAYPEVKRVLGAENVHLKNSNDVENELNKLQVLNNVVNKIEIAYTNDGSFRIKGVITTYQLNGKDYQNIQFKTAIIDKDQKAELELILNRLQNLYNDRKKFKYVIYRDSTFSFLSLFINFLPFLLLIGFYIWMMRSSLSQNGQAFSFGKSPARQDKSNTTFKDVAGCDEEKLELEEIIDFLKNPFKYKKMGARIPKGVLLVGPPGTGKTLLAKAVAGEANVPFFSISGSDFVEMFVGVGASRVRDLFKEAKLKAPCIIFMDEIDAVGRQRGAGLGGGHDEKEQTLNQLLVEMDGFGNHQGIIIMAATNRPDVLDPALLRPGRFDRQITIDLPDLKAREAILKVHARNKQIHSSVNLEDIARRTPGFSGADIENLMNEAALLATRKNQPYITIHELDEGMDRVMMGPAKTSRKYSEREKFIVSYHEAGHAVIGLKLENANEVQKVTIIPRGRTGGYNLMLPKEETFFHSKEQLLQTITGYLGGRASEELIFNSVTTGAHNDFERATEIARSMVCEYGMSDLGIVQYEQRKGDVFLGRDYLEEKNFSDAVAHEIDQEIRKITHSCYDNAKKILVENKDLLNAIAYYLREIETLTREDILEIEQTLRLKRWDQNHEFKEDELEYDPNILTKTLKQKEQDFEIKENDEQEEIKDKNDEQMLF